MVIIPPGIPWGGKMEPLAKGLVFKIWLEVLNLKPCK
jgi:hypothetical protein